MSIAKSRSGVLSFVAVLLSLMSPLFAQRSTADSQVYSQQSEVSLGQSFDDPNNLTPQRLAQLLRENPELVSECRTIVLSRLREQGRQPQGAVNEAFIANEVRTDPELKSRLSQALQKRGLLAQPLNTPDSSRGESKLLDSAQAPGKDLTQAQSGNDASKAQQQPQRTAPVKRQVPYGQLQALQDLYTQTPNDTTTLTRFGLDLFRSGSGNSDALPSDLPAGLDYVVGTGDGLNVHVWGSISQDSLQVVDRSGRIGLPGIDSLQIAGQTLKQAQDTVRKALAEHYKDVQVDLSLARIRTLRVYVVGEVLRPGVYDINALSTPMNALLTAGGPTVNGSLRVVKHFRGKKPVAEVDLYDLMINGVRDEFARLEPGDTILVPPVGPQVEVAGMVRRPAIYELKSGDAISQAVELAGGLLVSATLKNISVERVQAHERRVMLNLSLPDGSDKAGLETLLGSFKLQDGDRLTIAPILPYNEAAVYLEGHVFRPGKYPFRKGMQVSDLIKSNQDLLPEPAEQAQIIRLTSPDNRPVAIDFRLSDLLNGSDPLELQPFDTVRIAGRYEFDPPTVMITGQVLRPGEYPMANGMTVTELVRIAGGFTSSAYTEAVDVSSYVIENGAKVQTQHTQLNLAKALSGDKAADVQLKRRDVVAVRQLSGWADVGATVTLDGEVVYPGRYGISPGERLSSVLKRAGGFRNVAYPEGAVLERVQVRELAEVGQKDLIERIESQGLNLSFGDGTSAQEQQAMMQSMMAQQKEVITTLRRHPPTGRLVVKISSDIAKWENTQADIELSAGDVLSIPKFPRFVMVNGQVYNPVAMTYVPDRTVKWYLQSAGGFTEFANKGAVFVVHADGSVLSGTGSSLLRRDVMSARLQPGDTIVVPQKIVGGSSTWRNLLNMAQISSGLAIAAKVALSF